jgi:subtilisin-like proprotein convertase family protein
LTLNGKTPNGTWRLRMADSAAQDLGSLLSWSLQLVHQ